jgi:hypothetical protein
MRQSLFSTEILLKLRLTRNATVTLFFGKNAITYIILVQLHTIPTGVLPLKTMFIFGGESGV